MFGLSKEINGSCNSSVVKNAGKNRAKRWAVAVRFSGICYVSDHEGCLSEKIGGGAAYCQYPVFSRAYAEPSQEVDL